EVTGNNVATAVIAASRMKVFPPLITRGIVHDPAAGRICTDKKNADVSGLIALYFRGMHRGLAAPIAIAVLGLSTATAAASFHTRPYSGEASGERVPFTADTHHAHNFDWGSRQLFDNAAIEHLDGVWRFHTHSRRWRVHGHWDSATSVQGSICTLDSHG